MLSVEGRGFGNKESEWKRRREREGEGEGEGGEAILGIPEIPFDLFVSLKIRHHRIRFNDGFGNVVYTASTKPPPLVLFDSSANPLLSIFRSPDGSWKGFRGDGCGQELLFRVEQTLNTFNKLDFNVFLIGESGRNLAFAMRGCLFWRSCTIYQDKSIVAQTSLMYKLGFRKYFVRRSLFRVTVLPGFADYNFIAALVLIFLDGRKR